MWRLYFAPVRGTGSPADSIRSALADYVIEDRAAGIGMRPLVRGHGYWWVSGPVSLHDAIGQDGQIVPISPRFDTQAARDDWHAGGKAALELAALARLQLSGLTPAKIAGSTRVQDVLKELMWTLGVSR